MDVARLVLLCTSRAGICLNLAKFRCYKLFLVEGRSESTDFSSLFLLDSILL